MLLSVAKKAVRHHTAEYSSSTIILHIIRRKTGTRCHWILHHTDFYLYVSWLGKICMFLRGWGLIGIAVTKVLVPIMLLNQHR